MSEKEIKTIVEKYFEFVNSDAFDDFFALFADDVKFSAPFGFKGNSIEEIKPFYQDIPNKYIKTITVDNGSEFKGFKIIEELLECDVYFCDPYSAWQKGTVENHNGLLRQFLPKKKSFKHITEKEIFYLQKRLNNRPRKSMNFVKPCEAFWSESFALQN